MAGFLVPFLALLSTAAQDPAGVVVVFNAGSLAAPMRDLQEAFGRRYPRVQVRFESSGSVEAARKITDLGKAADVLASADVAVMDKLIVPRHASWYATFASNAMVIGFTERSRGAAEMSASTWTDILRRPGVRVGRADPALDPAGYRALFVLQLAERHFRIADFQRTVLRNSGARYTRPKSVELIALLETGHLDYAIIYRTVALGAGLPFLELPPEIDLSDPAHGSFYRTARVEIPRSRRTQDGELTFVGSPVAYAITVLRGAPNPTAGRAFVRFVLSSAGREILARHGFVLPPVPAVQGDTADAVRPAPGSKAGSREPISPSGDPATTGWRRLP